MDWQREKEMLLGSSSRAYETRRRPSSWREPSVESGTSDVAVDGLPMNLKIAS